MDAVSEAIDTFVKQGMGIDPSQMLTTLIATSVLFLVVFRFLWKPMTKLLEDRREIIKNDLDEAKEANQNALDIKEQLEQKLLEARIEAKNMIEASKSRGEQERVRIVKDAKLEAETRLSRAQDDISLEYQKARDSIKDEIVDVAFKVAEKIIEEEIDTKKHEKIVNKFLNEVNNAK